MKKQNVKIACFLISLILFIQLNAFAQAPEESLYKRLGGVYNIAAVVDDFVDRLLADPIITGNKNIVSAMGKITKPGLKYQITELLCQAAGGAQKYNGRSMKDSHQGLNITEAQWQAMMKDFLATLAKFNIKGLEQNELLIIVGSTKSDIVLSTPPEVPALPNAQPTNPAPQPLPNPNSLIPPQPPALPSIPSPQVPVIPALPNPANVVPSLPQLPPGIPNINSVQPKLELPSNPPAADSLDIPGDLPEEPDLE